MIQPRIDPSPVGELFRALGDPTRRQIYERLVRKEGKIAELIGPSGISQPAVSQHIAALRRAGLLTERKSGRSTFYRAEPSGLAPLVDWIAVQECFWRAALNRLEQFLAENGDGQDG
jgi:DNA-binding transcriptional ArsR family regulator